MDDVHAVGAFHRAGIIEQQNNIQRTARLAARGGGLDREAQQIAIMRERIARALRGETNRRARRRLRDRGNRRH